MNQDKRRERVHLEEKRGFTFYVFAAAAALSAYLAITEHSVLMWLATGAALVLIAVYLHLAYKYKKYTVT